MAVDLEALRKKHEEMQKKAQGQGGQDFLETFVQLQLGKNTVRILPGKEDTDLFYAETKIHRIPTGEGGIRNVHCRKVHGEQCPLCEAYFGLWKLFNEGGKVDKQYSDTARQIKPRDRFYLNVVDRSIEDTSKAVKILSIGQVLFNKITGIILDEDFGDITDLKVGHDFNIVKEMDGNFPKYDKSGARPRQTPAGSDKDVKVWMDSLHNIQGLVKLEDYDEVFNIAVSILPSLKPRPIEGGSTSSDDSDVSDEDYADRIKG